VASVTEEEAHLHLETVGHHPAPCQNTKEYITHIRTGEYMLKEKLSLRRRITTRKYSEVTYAALYSKDLIKKKYELPNEKENYELRPERLLALTSSTLHSSTHE
jgi:hypothetical protein